MAGIDLKALARVVNNHNLIITPKLMPWLLNHYDDPLPQWVADVIYEQLVTKPRDRSASFSASSAGHCLRRQVYAFLGVQNIDGNTQVIDPKLAQIFVDGKWRHLRLQAQLLSSGLITDIEFPLTWKRKRDRGTLDGIGVVPDDHPKPHWRGKTFGLEIKGTNSNVYRNLIDDGPDKFDRQYHRYFLSGGFDLFVVLAENKDTQAITEWVVEANPKKISDAKEELRLLNLAVDRQKLPVRLPDCTKKTGDVFRSCPFGTRHGPCARLNTYQQTEQEVSDGTQAR